MPDVVYLITTLGVVMGENGDPVTVEDPTSSITAVQVASLFIGIFIPILVGLVTKTTTSATVKSVLLLVLSAVSGFLTEFVNDANFIWQQALLTAVVTFVTGVAFHYGLWRPSGVTATVQAVGSGTSGGNPPPGARAA